MNNNPSLNAVDPDASVVLVVDDHNLVRKMVTSMLTNEGFTVRSAATGAEAIDLVRTDQSVVCVLQDLSMPFMTGDEVIAELNRIRPDLSILVYSAEEENVVTHRLSQLSISGYIQKPFDPEALIIRLRELMRS